MGFEPMIESWQDSVLPLHHIRIGTLEWNRTIPPRFVVSGPDPLAKVNNSELHPEKVADGN
jgi:hypothetical protein